MTTERKDIICRPVRVLTHFPGYTLPSQSEEADRHEVSSQNIVMKGSFCTLNHAATCLDGTTAVGA